MSELCLEAGVESLDVVVLPLLCIDPSVFEVAISFLDEVDELFVVGERGFKFETSVVVFFDELTGSLENVFGCVDVVVSVVVLCVSSIPDVCGVGLLVLEDLVVFVALFFFGELKVSSLTTEWSSCCFCIVFGTVVPGTGFLNKDGSYTCFSSMIRLNSS